MTNLATADKALLLKFLCSKQWGKDEQRKYEALLMLNLLPWEVWMNAVNHCLIQIASVHSMGIPDYDYRVEFEAGTTPREAAVNALAAADFPFEEVFDPSKDYDE